MTDHLSQDPGKGNNVEQESLVPLAEPTGSEVVERPLNQLKTAHKEENILVSLGFALGLGALLFLNTYAIPGVLGLLFSVIGLIQVNRKGEEGRGFALWGIALSLLSLIWLGLHYLGVVTTPGMLFNFLKAALGFRT